MVRFPTTSFVGLSLVLVLGNRRLVPRERGAKLTSSFLCRATATPLPIIVSFKVAVSHPASLQLHPNHHLVSLPLRLLPVYCPLHGACPCVVTCHLFVPFPCKVSEHVHPTHQWLCPTIFLPLSLCHPFFLLYYPLMTWRSSCPCGLLFPFSEFHHAKKCSQVNILRKYTKVCLV